MKNEQEVLMKKDICEGRTAGNDREFAKKVREKIHILQEYIDKHGEEDINEYLKEHGTYKGIEDYLYEKERLKESQS